MKTVFAILTTFSLLIAQRNTELWTLAGKRVVPFHQNDPTDYGFVDTGPLPHYSYLVMMRIPDLDKVESEFGVDILEVNQLDRNFPIYTVSVPSSFTSIRSQMASSLPSFHNLVPVLTGEAISQRIVNDTDLTVGEKDSITGQIYATAGFFKGVSQVVRDSLVSLYADSLLEGGIIRAPWQNLIDLSEENSVQQVVETDIRPGLTLDFSRATIGVDAIQNFDTTMTFPDTAASPPGIYTGRGVTVGVWDTGIDTLHNNFRTLNASDDTVARIADLVGWKGPGFHGTHVAGICCGSGWESAGSGGGPYQYRGIAWKSLVASRNTTDTGNSYHVNNHSHIIDRDGIYSIGSNKEQGVDEVIHFHGPGQGIVVYAAANNGSSPFHGKQRAYFSVLGGAKNVITVGASAKRVLTGVRAPLSSFGPSRDGRVKPDLMAPGDDKLPTAERGLAHPHYVEIDFIRLHNQSGTIVQYDFNASAEGWPQFTNDINVNSWNPGDTILSAEIVNTVTHFKFDSYMGSPLFGNHVVTDFDTVTIRYRIEKNDEAENSGYDQLGGEVFAYLNGKGLTFSKRFIWDMSDDQFKSVSIPVRELGFGDRDERWSGNFTINQFRIDFNGAPTTDILSAVKTDRGPGSPTRPFPFYTHENGTSMAAPHVSGVAALLLEKYFIDYLDPQGLNLDDDAFWNSTAKAILIHSATDLVKTSPYPGENFMLEFDDTETYHEGPDFSTGYGLVNAEAAIDYVDTNLFKERTIENGEQHLYQVTIPAGQQRVRFTLAWDDAPGDGTRPFHHPKLINDLDIQAFDPVNGQAYFPWTLDPLPQDTTALPGDGLDDLIPSDIKPAYKAKDFRNNMEVIDLEFPGAGDWIVSVSGARVPSGIQDYSLVSDFPLIPINNQIGDFVDSIEQQWVLDLPITSSVAIDGNTAYFGVDDDSLSAFDLVQGTTQSRVHAPNIKGPVVSGGGVFISVGNEVRRYVGSLSSGTPFWSTQLGGNASAPMVQDAFLYVGSGNTAYALDANTGDIVSSIQNQDGNQFVATPVYNSVTDLVLFADEDAFVHAISVDGSGNMTLEYHRAMFHPGSFSTHESPTVGPSGLTALWDAHQLDLIGTNGFPVHGLPHNPPIEIEIMSSVLWDPNDVIYFIGSQAGEDAVKLLTCNLDLSEVWLATLREGFPSRDEVLGSTSDLVLAADGTLHFVFDNTLYAIDMNGQVLRNVPLPGKTYGSPNVYQNDLILGSGRSLFRIGIGAGLMLSWAREGATAAATSAPPMQHYQALYPDTVGEGTNILSQWTSNQTEYQFSGITSGFEGTSDGMLHATTFTNDDFEVSAKVESLNSPSTAGVGLMISINTEPKAPGEFSGGWNLKEGGIRGIVYLDPSGNVKFNSRDEFGSNSVEAAATGTYSPGSTWFKMAKQGSKVLGYVSNNGYNYIKVGEFDLPLDTNGYASLVHTSGDETQTSSATLSQISVNRSPRTTNGLLALHTYNETEGEDVFDVSGLDNPVNLKIFGNKAELLRKGGLQFTGTDHNSVAQEVTSSQKFFDASTTSDEVTIEAWIQPGNLSAFYDRILYYAVDGTGVNWMLTQKDKNIAFKLRTSFHALKVLETTSDPLSSTTSIYHVVATYKPYDNGEGGMRIYVDGELQSVNGEGGTLDGGGTYPWKSDAKFAVGNTPTGTSSPLDWDGKIFLSAVYSTQMDTSEVIKNFKAGFSSPLFDFGDWAYETEIDLNTTSSGADVPVNVKDFPVLIRLDNSNFRFIEARENGEDIRFSTIGNSPLPHVIEKWDESNEEAIIWVKTDVPGNTLSTIRMYWGNPDAEDISSGGQVFEEENGFAAVYHLSGDPSQGVADGSSAGQNGTAQGGMNASSRVTGIIGDALRFDGYDDYVDLGTMYQDFSGGVTLCGWMKYEAFQSWSRLADLGAGESQHNIYLGNQGTSGDARFDIHNSGYSVVDVSGVFQLGEWKHVCGTEDGSGAMQFYANGVQVGSTQGQTPANVARTKSYLAKSNWSADAKYKGKIDEVWISTVGRDANWIKLSYENQKASQTLVTVHPGNNQILDGRYQIKVVHSGKCLDVAGAAGSSLALAEGTDMQQVSCADESDKQWDIYHLGSGVYKMVNVGSGYALDVDGAQTVNGAKLIQWSYTGATNQKFYILYLGNGQYKIEAKHSGKVLDVEAAGQYDGNKVIQWTYHGGLNQRWIFETVE